MFGAKSRKPAALLWARAPRAKDVVNAAANGGRCGRRGRAAAPGKGDQGKFRAAPLEECQLEFGELIVQVFADAWTDGTPRGTAPPWCVRLQLQKF